MGTSENEINLITLRPIGRSGSFFLQNLFDGHPKLMLFPFPFPFYYHWFRLHLIQQNPSRDEIISFFVERTSLKYLFRGNTGVFSSMFYSHVDKQSKKIVEYKIDKAKFIQNLLAQLHGRSHSRKDMLIALHIAYEKTVGGFSSLKRTIFLHEHYSTFPLEPLEDFPTSKHIFMTRSAPSSYASYIKFNEKYRGFFAPLYQCIDLCDSMRAKVNARVLQSECHDRGVYMLATEDLNAYPEINMRKLFSWLDLSFGKEVLRPTFAGHDKEGTSMFSWHQNGFDQSGMNQDRSRGVCSQREVAILTFLFSDFTDDDHGEAKWNSVTHFLFTLMLPDIEILKLRYRNITKLLLYFLAMGPIATRLAFLWCYFVRDRRAPLLPWSILLKIEEFFSKTKFLKRIFRIAN